MVDELTMTIEAAQEHFKNKNYIEALQQFEQLSQSQPESAIASDRCAQCYAALNRWEEARTHWLRAIDRHGKTTDRVVPLARSLIELREYAAASELLAASLGAGGAHANLSVCAVVASLGDDKPEAALAHAQRVDRCGSEPALAYLSGLLLRLARQKHGEAVLRLFDELLRSTPHERRHLRTATGLAGFLKRWEAKLGYARRLTIVEPDASYGYVHEAHALLQTRDYVLCRNRLAALVDRFPKAELVPDEARLLQTVELRLKSIDAWISAATDADESQSFQALNMRSAAFMALRNYAGAAAAARHALETHQQHPWFMILLGRCCQELGEHDEALAWLTKATDAAPDIVDYQLHLHRAQLRAGLADKAMWTLGKLRRKYPNSFIIRALSDDTEPQTPPRTTPARVDDRMTWLHGGDSGDLIYALASMRAAGGGDLYLTCIEATREPMSASKIAFLSPLLDVQPYVRSIQPWQGEEVTKNFNVFRHKAWPQMNLATRQWLSVIDDQEPDITSSWLTVPSSTKHGRPVFARSSRYRNANWEGLWADLKASCPDAIFVGTAPEFEEFDHGEHYFARDALGLAEIINGASVFVGNQSLPYAIAEGLKVGRLLEVSPSLPNCRFPGALALDLQRPV